MRARMLIAMGLAALTVAGTAAAQGGGGELERTMLVDLNETGPTSVELDGDAAPERVAARKLNDFEYAPRIEDDCLGARRTGPTHEHVTIEAVKTKSTPGLPFLWTSGSSGATGRLNEVRLHRLQRPIETGCPTLETLFAYPGHKDFRLPRPRKGTEAGSYSATLRVVDGELRIRTYEGLYRRTDGGCCPSFRRTSDWRYSSERARYVRTRSRTVRTRSATRD